MYRVEEMIDTDMVNQGHEKPFKERAREVEGERQGEGERERSDKLRRKEKKRKSEYSWRRTRDRENTPYLTHTGGVYLLSHIIEHTPP